MDVKVKGAVDPAVQRSAQSTAMYLGPIETWDSGFDSDEDPLTARGNRPNSSPLSDSSGDDDYEILHEMKKEDRKEKKKYEKDELNNMVEDQRESLDILIQWRKNGNMREPTLSESTADRSSPPLYEVELTASDEDDDASVLELVIPMQSRYQRVPTSSPKKTKPKTTTLFSNLFCCIRK